MQDLQSCLGLSEARCRREVWRNHYERAGDAGERCRKRIHIVIVGFEEFHTLLLPLRRFLGIPYDSSNLLAICKKGACNGAAYIPCDSYDCVHIDASWFLIVVMGDIGRPKWRLSPENSYQACYSGRAIPLRRSQIARSRSCMATLWAAGRVPFL